jgi:hypothetical protein
VQIVYEALRTVPPNWTLGISYVGEGGMPYFFNTKTKVSSWSHPEEAKYVQKVEEVRGAVRSRSVVVFLTRFSCLSPGRHGGDSSKHSSSRKTRKTTKGSRRRKRASDGAC